MTSFYKILGLETRQYDSLTATDVKTAYKRALLLYHPDKTPHRTEKHAQASVTVDEIALAYKTISNPDLRLEYDRVLAQDLVLKEGAPTPRTHHPGLEIVDLDHLAFEDETQTWSRSCRCGDKQGFVVTEPELEEHSDQGELVVGCKGCSLWLKVLFSAAI